MKILVSALEHSANIHLKSLLRHLNSYELMGIFDSSLGEPIVDMQKDAIMGFVDAIKRLPLFLKLAKDMTNLAKNADIVLLIDSSGFNLPLAKKIKKRYPKKQIIYYVLPQAWAWKRKRVFTLTKNVDTLLSILPFEKEYYPKEANIKYVGHPLLDKIKKYKSQVAKDDKKILFMPGSRRAEIIKLMPIFRELSTNFKDRELLLAIPKHLKKSLDIYGDIKDFKVTYDSQQALKEADFAFICSGTATLEATIVGTPLILSYIAKPIDYLIGKLLIKLNYIGLANIFFEHINKKQIHPELIQNEVTAVNLYSVYLNYNKENFIKNSIILRDYLQNGSSKNVAIGILKTLKNSAT